MTLVLLCNCKLKNEYAWAVNFNDMLNESFRTPTPYNHILKLFKEDMTSLLAYD